MPRRLAGPLVPVLVDDRRGLAVLPPHPVPVQRRLLGHRVVVLRGAVLQRVRGTERGLWEVRSRADVARQDDAPLCSPRTSVTVVRGRMGGASCGARAALWYPRCCVPHHERTVVCVASPCSMGAAAQGRESVLQGCSSRRFLNAPRVHAPWGRHAHTGRSLSLSRSLFISFVLAFLLAFVLSFFLSSFPSSALDCRVAHGTARTRGGHTPSVPERS